MVLIPIFLGGVWFRIHRYSVFHTFIWKGWVGGLSQMKLTSFEKNCHILRRSLIINFTFLNVDVHLGVFSSSHPILLID